MQFNNLGKSGTIKTPKKDVPVNLAVRLERIEIDADKGNFFHGMLVDGGEPVSVRMCTIEEGVKVNMRSGESVDECTARMRKQYVGNGESHRPKASEIASAEHKAHCQTGGLLMFTKAMKNADGTYRAHWVDTIERAPGAGCDKLMTHIQVEDRKDPLDKTKIIGTQVVADTIDLKAAVVLTRENAAQTLLSALANRNGDVKLKPFFYARIIDAFSGKVVLQPRGSAQYDKKERKDADSGEVMEYREAADANVSLTNIMSAENTGKDAAIIRAALHGINADTGYTADVDTAADPGVAADLKLLTEGVRAGALLIEVVPGQRISAGPATRASIIKNAKNNPNNPINTVYSVRNEHGFTKERRFCETYMTTRMGKDGHLLFTKAVPADSFPKALTIKALATVNDHKANAVAEAAARADAANATHVDIEHLPFDASALEGDLPGEVNELLAQSSAALEAEM